MLQQIPKENNMDLLQCIVNLPSISFTSMDQTKVATVLQLVALYNQPESIELVTTHVSFSWNETIAAYLSEIIRSATEEGRLDQVKCLVSISNFPIEIIQPYIDMIEENAIVNNRSDLLLTLFSIPGFDVDQCSMNSMVEASLQAVEYDLSSSVRLLFTLLDTRINNFWTCLLTKFVEFVDKNDLKSIEIMLLMPDFSLAFFGKDQVLLILFQICSAGNFQLMQILSNHSSFASLNLSSEQVQQLNLMAHASSSSSF